MIDLILLIITGGLLVTGLIINYIVSLPDPLSKHLNYNKEFLERERKEVKSGIPSQTLDSSNQIKSNNKIKNNIPVNYV